MRKIAGSLVLLAALSGCVGKDTYDQENTVAGNYPMNSKGIDDTIMFLTQDVQDDVPGVNVTAKRTIHFGFDKSQLTEEEISALKEHAAFLAMNPEARIRIEGHTDERGSREYNMGLGERRAKSVQKMLLSMGVAPDQMTVISYGKERLANPAHDDDAHAYNRRAVIVYEAV